MIKMFLPVMASVLFSISESNSQTIAILYDSYGNRLTKSVTGTYPNPTLTGDSSICQGATAHLYATGGASYLWSNGSTANAIAFPADSTRIYSVTAYSAIGCATTVQRLLTVKPVPVTGPITGDTVVYVGDTIVYNVPGHTGSFYDWGFVNGNYGTIDTGYSRHAVSIVWAKAGSDSITVYERVSNGCNSVLARLHVTIISRTGVPGVQAEEFISVYPNPTSNGARVKIKLAKAGDVLIIVTDNVGRRMGRVLSSGQSHYELPLDKSFFPASGIYNIQVSCGDKTFNQKLTVIY